LHVCRKFEPDKHKLGFVGDCRHLRDSPLDSLLGHVVALKTELVSLFSLRDDVFTVYIIDCVDVQSTS